MKLALMVAAVLAFGLVLGPLNSTCCLVGPQAPYHAIQSALDAAEPGGAVVVLPGVYRENLVIRKPVRLLSADQTLLFPFVKGPVRLQAPDGSRPAVEVRAPEVIIQGFSIQGGSSGVALRDLKRARLVGNEITDSDGSGVLIERTEHVTLRENRIHGHATGVALSGARHISLIGNEIQNNDRGVVLTDTQRTLIRGNRLQGHASEALALERSPHNSLLENSIEENGRGLVLDRSPDNRLRANRIRASGTGFEVRGEAADYVQNIDRSNTLDGSPIYYLVGLKGRAIAFNFKEPPGFVALVKAQGVKLTNLAVSHRAVGLLLVETRDTEVGGGAFLGNGIGILLVGAQGTRLLGNRIADSASDGIRLEGSSGNTLEGNEVLRSGADGLRLLDSHANRIRGNRISNSARSAAHVEASNGNAFEGNEFADNGKFAVLLKDSQENQLQNNIFQSNWIGVYLEGARRARIRSNRIHDNQWGIFLLESSENAITGNDLSANRRGGIGGSLSDNAISDNVDEEGAG